MDQPLPQNKYLFAKLDKEFRYVYANELHHSLFQLESPNILGKTLYEVRTPPFLHCVMDEAITTVKQKGYAYTVTSHNAPDGNRYWGFVDLTRRFGATADSGMIGYELVSYPASRAIIDFFNPIYEEVDRLEQSTSASEAIQYLHNCIAETGKSYDELVHTLQNS